MVEALQPAENDPLKMLEFWAGDLRTRNEMINYMWGIIGNRAEAEEIFQEALTRTFLSIRKGNIDPERFSRAYVYRAAVNIAKDRFKERKRIAGAIEKRGADAVSVITTGSHLSFYEDTEGNQMSYPEIRISCELAIRAAEAGLSQVQLETINMRADGTPYEEIAEATGVAIGTVMSRLFRAREKMQAWKARNRST